MPMPASVGLSMVIPLFNEGENVDALVAACVDVLENRDGELILVDDGSTDDTAERIRRHAEQHALVRAISLRRRFGKGAALAAGLARARGDRIATIDGDLQEDPADLPKLLGGLEQGYDLVTGWRKVRRDSWSKRVSSRMFNWLMRLTTGLDLHDVNCGFKVMRRSVASELILTGGRFRFVALLAHWWGFRVGEVEIPHRRRERGQSSFGSRRFPGALIDLFAIACLIRYHSRPGHLFIQAGGVSALFGFGICAYIAWIRFTLGHIANRYPLLALGVLLLVLGVQLLATGFLAEWMAYRDRRSSSGYRVKWDVSDADDEPQ